MKNAIEDGWIKKIVRTRLFNLLTLIKIGNPRLSHIAIYIEGDGDAWIDEDTISLSPTPKVPVTLSLAFSDPLPNILYISRPCQFVKKLNLRNCNPKYWSHHRYSPEVVAAIVEAINIIKKENNINSIELIGYSGGGTMAALISSGRFGFDVKRLITVAGNLDTHEWTKYLNVSPLWGSLNPATYSNISSNIPQFHLSGSNDDLVPTDILRKYLKKQNIEPAKAIMLFNGFTHYCCWPNIWYDTITKIRSD